MAEGVQQQAHQKMAESSSVRSESSHQSENDRSMGIAEHFKEQPQQRVYMEKDWQSVSSVCSQSSTEASPFPQSERTKEVTCDICYNCKAVKTCLTCNVSYCEEDVKQHYIIPALQRHNMVDVTEEVDTNRCQHLHRNLDIYCRTDQMQICIYCSETSHLGHDFVSMKAPEADQMHSSLITAALPPPGEITIRPLTTDSVIVSWKPPEDPDIPRQFRITWQCEEETNTLRVSNVCQVEVGELKLGGHLAPTCF